MGKKTIRRQRLANGLLLEFTDLSNRYFGDYHRVLIEASCRIPLSVDLFAEESDPQASLASARRLVGDEVEFRRQLSRMGVAGDDVASVRDELIDSFLRHSLEYLQSTEFPSRFVRKSLAAVGRKGHFTPRII